MTTVERDLGAAERLGRALIHETRNVLTPIISATFLLETHADDPVKVRDLAKRIETFAKAEARLVAKMREVLDDERLGRTQSTGPEAGVPPASVPSSIIPPQQ